MFNDYVLPNNREAEEALIGSVLIDNSLLKKPTVASITGEDFYLHRNGWIWDACVSLGDTLDVLTLNALLEKRGVLEEAGGAPYIAALLVNIPSAMNAERYAEIVRELAIRRRDIRIGQTIVSKAYEGTLDRAKYVDMLSKNEKVEGGAESLHNSLKQLVDMVEERSKNPKEIWGIPTQFTDLDKKIGGLHPEQTIIFAATAGKGKSVLAMQIAKNIAEQGIGVAIYSFEMSARRVLMRLLSADSGVPTRAMNTGHMADHWDSFYESVERLDKLPIYLADIFGMETSMLRADLATLKAKHDVQLIVVDYLNKLLDHDGGDDLANTKLKARRMQGICREFQVAGILIQSMNKEGMRSTVPTMADMSGPSEVAHEADVVFLMGVHPENPKLVQLYPAKMRDGDTAHTPITLKWADYTPKFVNYMHENNIALEWFHD